MFRKLLNVFRQRHLDDEIRQELETHLASLEEEELARAADDPQAARRRAALRFGNPSSYRERTREVNLAAWLDDVWRDLKFASRQLLRNPGFAASAILLLALGIGVNASIFTVISSVILRPLPLPEPDRLLSVLERSGRFDTPLSWPDFADIRDGNRVFESVGGFTSPTFVFRGGADSLNIRGSNATPDYFTTLGVQPIAGRLFVKAEGETEGNQIALLREDFWKTALNADPEVLQKPILVNGQATQVVGILPEAFRFPTADTVIWMPLIARGPLKNRGFHAVSMVGRLKRSVTAARAQADLEVIMRRLARDYPEPNTGHSAKAVLLQDQSFDKRLRERLAVLQIAALALFLMACANVSSLLLARHSARRAEFEIRAALGSSRLRRIRQHLTESLLLTGSGCVAAVGLTVAGVRFLVWLYGEQMPRASEISPDWRLVGAVIAVALGGALTLGLVAAFRDLRQTSRFSGGAGDRISADRGGVLTRQALVVFQVTCAVVLLASTGAVLRSFRALLRTDVGFDRSHLVTMRISLPSSKYRTGAAVAARFESLASRVGFLAGVRQAAAINMLPVAEWGFNGNVSVEGLPDEHQNFFAEYRWITQDYFRTVGIPLLRGRQFLPEEVSGKQPAAIINQTMARRLWGDRDPLGSHIRMFSPEWITVVGIARDVRQSGVTVPSSPEVYLPGPGIAIAAPSWSVVVRSDLSAESLLPAIRGAVRAEEQDAAVDRVKSMDDVVADSVSAQRIVTALLLCFAVLALVLASLGLYGLVTFTVVARLPELAIRSALGSTPCALVGLVGREGIALIAAGLAIGVAAIVPLQPLLNKFIFDVGQISVLVSGAVLLVLLACGAVAVAVPALRAARIDPIRILRNQ